MTTYNALTKQIESLKADLASINNTLDKIQNDTRLIEFREEKINSALKLKSEIEQHIQKLETERRTLMLQAQKAALQDCINEAKTDDELATFTAMLAKFNTLHPEI